MNVGWPGERHLVPELLQSVRRHRSEGQRVHGRFPFRPLDLPGPPAQSEVNA